MSKAMVGDPAPELTLPNESGVEFSLTRHRGRPILLSFLSHAA